MDCLEYCGINEPYESITPRKDPFILHGLLIIQHLIIGVMVAFQPSADRGTPDLWWGRGLAD